MNCKSNLKNPRGSIISVILVLVLVIFISSIYTTGSNTITYQGALTTLDGNIISNGTYGMRFSLWNMEIGGVEAENQKWSEIQTAVKIMKGQFSVELGKITSFPEDLFKENEKLWVEVAIDLDGSGFKVIGQREPLPATPYAYVSDEAYRADYATKAGIAEEARSLEGYSLKDILASKEADLYWNLLGNAGTTPGTNFLGTTDNQALEIKVNNKRSIRIEPTTKASNIIGGHIVNTVTSSVYGATIGGGGNSGWVNTVTDNYGTIGGGASNRAGDNAGTVSDRQFATVGGGYANNAKGFASTVPGGYWNTAASTYSFAAGRRARANHTGTFVWADSTNADFASSTYNQFLIRASGGVGINTNSLGAYGLRVAGSVAIDGNLNMGYDGTSGRIMYMQDPVSAKDAATKQYVDNKVSSSLSALDKLIHNFVVATGESVTAGDVVVFINDSVKKGPKIPSGSEYVFNSEITDSVSASALSSDQFVVAYRDIDNANYGTTVIGEVSGSVITYGSEYIFNSSITERISVAVLSETKFVIAYSNGGNPYYGTAIIGTVIGNTINFLGSPTNFNNAAVGYLSVTSLNDNKFVVAYMSASGGVARVGLVSESSIDFSGSVSSFNSASTTAYISSDSLSSSKFVVAYEDYDNSYYGTAVIGDVIGTNISFGSEYIFNSTTTTYVSASALSSDKFVVFYTDTGDSGYGTARVGTVSGTVITYNLECVFNSANTMYISSSALSLDKFVVTYRDQGNSDYGTARVGEVSGTTIVYDGEKVFNSAGTTHPSVSTLSSDKFVVAYSDDGNSNYGTGIIGIIGVPVGIANASASSGASVPVVIQGVSSNHVGLVPGKFYYHQTDGSLSTDWTNTRIGVAISSTELLLDIEHY